MKVITNLAKTAPIVGEFKLPSQGLTYVLEGDQKFPPTIKIKPYSFVTESILVTNLSSSDKMVKVIQDVAELPEKFDPHNLLVADQYMILAIARSLTYGEKYNFSSVCPSCGTRENHSLRVPEEIPCKIWTDKKVSDGPDAAAYINISRFTVRLPVCKDTVELRFLTIADGDRATKYGEEKKKITPSTDSAYIRRYAMHIKSLNGELVDGDYETLEKEFLLKLKGEDMIFLKDKIEELSCGIVQNWDIACKDCGRQYKAYIPIVSNFFRRD